MKKLLTILVLSISITVFAEVKVTNTLPEKYNGKWYAESVKDFKEDGSSTPAERVAHILFCTVRGGKVILNDTKDTTLTILQIITEKKLYEDYLNICFKEVHPDDIYWTIRPSIIGDTNFSILEIYKKNFLSSAFIIAIEKE